VLLVSRYTGTSRLGFCEKNASDAGRDAGEDVRTEVTPGGPANECAEDTLLVGTYTRLARVRTDNMVKHLLCQRHNIEHVGVTRDITLRL
jgi:hypothetical protein